jgi:hypothetical protein
MWQNQSTQGPVASMDNFFFCGSPNFQGQVSANKANPFWVPLNNTVYWLWYYNSQSCANNPTFGGNGQIQPIAYQHLPSLTVYEQEAMKQPSRSSPSFGCYYFGSTTMVFNADGTVDVSSPNSTVGSSPGQTNPGCPLGTTNTSFASGFNGAVYVGGTSSSGCTASSGPPPPPGWGPPVFELGYNPPGGNGFSGVWEPQQTGVTPSTRTSPSGWMLSWETNDHACQGDLFVQGTVTASVTLAAQYNLYLTGSLCVPADTTCQETNETGSTSYGNSMGPVSYSQSSLPVGGPMIGVVAGNLVKAYNPTSTPSNANPLDWSIGFNSALNYCLGIPCGIKYFYFSLSLDFSGAGLNHENNLEGYPHANIVVDGVVFDHGGGTTTQQMPDANQAGATATDMTDPNPFDHISASYPALGNFDVNGASVEEFAPNLSCNQVTLPLVGNAGTCSTYTDLEIPYPWMYFTSCPSTTPQPSADTGGDWGPIWSYQISFAGFNLACPAIDAYQYVLSHTVGYTANFVYNPSLSTGLPPWFPNPEPESILTSTVSVSDSTVRQVFGSMLTG